MTMKTMEIDKICIASCFLVGLFCTNELSNQLEEGRACKVELEKEYELRMQAELIDLHLVDQRADEWCEDSIDRVHQSLLDCHIQNETMATDMNVAMDLWGDYTSARIDDCESRDLKTKKEREDCLGPAAHYEEVIRALEAMSIHRESKELEKKGSNHGRSQ